MAFRSKFWVKFRHSDWNMAHWHQGTLPSQDPVASNLERVSKNTNVRWVLFLES